MGQAGAARPLAATDELGAFVAPSKITLLKLFQVRPVPVVARTLDSYKSKLLINSARQILPRVLILVFSVLKNRSLLKDKQVRCFRVLFRIIWLKLARIMT